MGWWKPVTSLLFTLNVWTSPYCQCWNDKLHYNNNKLVAYDNSTTAFWFMRCDLDGVRSSPQLALQNLATWSVSYFHISVQFNVLWLWRVIIRGSPFQLVTAALIVNPHRQGRLDGENRQKERKKKNTLGEDRVGGSAQLKWRDGAKEWNGKD